MKYLAIFGILGFLHPEWPNSPPPLSQQKADQQPRSQPSKYLYLLCVVGLRDRVAIIRTLLPFITGASYAREVPVV